MLRLHHVSLKSNNIVNLKNFYVYLFNAKVVHKFENNKNVYGYFLLLGKNNFIEILSYEKEKKLTNMHDIRIHLNLMDLEHACF